jgi:hypothetical protein
VASRPPYSGQHKNENWQRFGFKDGKKALMKLELKVIANPKGTAVNVSLV